MAAAISSESGEDLGTLIKRNDHIAILRHIRSHQLREPYLVLQHGKALLPATVHEKNNSTTMTYLSIGMSALGLAWIETDHMAILEQMFIAALDVNDQDLADRCLHCMKQLLASTMGLKPDGISSSSIRIRRLIALQKESQEDYDGALDIYNAMLTENPANSVAYKRKYAILKAQVGKEILAMEELNTYLSYNQGDAAGWFEMSNACTMVGNYKGAVYCHEELILMQPHDASLHCKLGELYVTIGTTLSNLILARKHIATSLELSGISPPYPKNVLVQRHIVESLELRGGRPPHPNNLRALYALVDAAATYLVETSSFSSSTTATSRVSKKREPPDEKDGEVAKALLKYGVEMLLKSYCGTPMFPVVKDVMDGYSELLCEDN